MRAWIVRGVVAILAILSFDADGSSTGADPFNALGPLEQMVEFFTGGFGRFLVILGLGAAALLWWKSREEMSEKLFGLIGWGVGAALFLGAPDIVDALGFASATF
jgi:type IV secretory pathway VirB2 component (pilin)